MVALIFNICPLRTLAADSYELRKLVSKPWFFGYMELEYIGIGCLKNANISADMSCRLEATHRLISVKVSVGICKKSKKLYSYKMRLDIKVRISADISVITNQYRLYRYRWNSTDMPTLQISSTQRKHVLFHKWKTISIIDLHRFVFVNIAHMASSSVKTGVPVCTTEAQDLISFLKESTHWRV